MVCLEQTERRGESSRNILNGGFSPIFNRQEERVQSKLRATSPKKINMQNLEDKKAMPAMMNEGYKNGMFLSNIPVPWTIIF